EEVVGVALAVELDVPVVAPEIIGIVVVGVALAVVAEEEVEAALDRIADGAGRAEAPLADGGGGGALLLDQLAEEPLAGGDGGRALGLDLAVVADPGVPAVHAGHQAAARGGADRRAGVELGEAQPLAGHAVQAGRADLLLAVAAQLAVA